LGLSHAATAASAAHTYTSKLLQRLQQLQQAKPQLKALFCGQANVRGIAARVLRYTTHSRAAAEHPTFCVPLPLLQPLQPLHGRDLQRLQHLQQGLCF
jgi:hypothetical protein